MHTNRRSAIGLLGCTLLPWSAAHASDRPTRPVKLVYPFTPGGTGDTVVRGVAEGLSRIWGVPVIVDNRPGAGGMIGTSAVAKAEPDGHTLLLTLTFLIQTPLLFNNPPYDPIADFAAISRVATLQSLMAVNRQLPVRTLSELVAHARQQGKLAYGTAGIGSSNHLQMEKLAKELEIPVEHVAYKGEAQLITDLIGGQIGVGFITAVSASKFRDRVQAIAIGGTQRSPLLPDVPTLVESGSQAMATSGWFALLAPAKTPPALVERVALDLRQVLEDARLRQQLADIGVTTSPSSPQEFARQMKQDQQYWAGLMQAAGIPRQ
jgi:tripartite-type tricarboxylate transporter receptor subunit TctC